MAEFKFFPNDSLSLFMNLNPFVTCVYMILKKKLLQEQNLLALEMPQGEMLQYLTFLLTKKKKKDFIRWSRYFGENLVFYLPV